MLFPDSGALVASLSAATASCQTPVEGFIKIVSRAISAAIADRHGIRDAVGGVLGARRVHPPLQEIVGAWRIV